MWFLCNADVHESIYDKEVDVVDWARNFLDEFLDNCIVTDSMPDKTTPRNPIWIPPALAIYKINCDATLAGRLVGVGIVIRDSEGFVMASSSQKIEVTLSPQVAEAVAIFRGIKLTIETSLTSCCIESGAEVVVGWINSKNPLCSKIGVVIDDIHVLLEQVHCGSINFVSRKANQVAHMLAKNGISFVENMFWLEEFLPCWFLYFD
ncbi:hypothetical protein Ddye_010658 [Dipteronia dyeriana]|uniref:RNase H type-1 domain-containing protein n=1 Tax=Dipteronia dyeriana TaxID=168575 RepID=A0AAD9XEA9_9ROSI|nr:hypothetical protein Ddye_010658 [Dipteronia dyeriana]